MSGMSNKAAVNF